MDAGLEANHRQALSLGVADEVIEHKTAEAAAAKRGAHPHPLDLGVLPADEHDAAASGRHPVVARDEEGDLLAQQLLDAEPVTALARIETREVRLEFLDERGGVRSVRALLMNDGSQR